MHTFGGFHFTLGLPCTSSRGIPRSQRTDGMVRIEYTYNIVLYYLFIYFEYKCHPPTCLVYLCPLQSSPWPSCIGNGMSVGYRINLGRHTAAKSYSTEGAPLDGRPPTLPCKPICSFRSADLFLMVRLVVAWSGVLHSSNSHPLQPSTHTRPHKSSNSQQS